MHVLTAALAALLAVPLSHLSAQQGQQVAVGERVRVSQCHSELLSSGYRGTVCKRSIGTLTTLSFNAATVRVEDGADEYAFALDSVTALEVSRGRHRRWGRGALIGSVVGGAVGLILSVTYVAEDCVWGCDGDEAAVIGFITALGGTGAGIIGAGIGAVVKTERWKKVPLERLRVSFAPRRDGRVLMGVAIAFQ